MYSVESVDLQMVVKFRECIDQNDGAAENFKDEQVVLENDSK